MSNKWYYSIIIIKQVYAHIRFYVTCSECYFSMHALIWWVLKCCYWWVWLITLPYFYFYFFHFCFLEEVCEPAYRKKEVETLSPSDHRSDNPSSPHRTNHFMVCVFSWDVTLANVWFLFSSVICNTLSKHKPMHHVVVFFLLLSISVIVQMQIWLWCNCSERTSLTVTPDPPAFILCSRR